MLHKLTTTVLQDICFTTYGNVSLNENKPCHYLYNEIFQLLLLSVNTFLPLCLIFLQNETNSANKMANNSIALISTQPNKQLPHLIP